MPFARWYLPVPVNTPSWPSFVTLLTSGGDARINCDEDGTNKYGCAPMPQPDILSYSSSTASSISTRGFAAAGALYQRLSRTEPTPDLYLQEIQRIHCDLRSLCELGPDTEIILDPSGTDSHRTAARMLQPSCIIMSEPAETGSGIPKALADGDPDILTVTSRLQDGNLRPLAEIDHEVATLVEQAIAAKQRLLLIVTDSSKTGLIIPSIACAIALKQRHPQAVSVLVDACQFRLTNATIHAYLTHGFLLAVTGSKFLGGPAFSAALLVPYSAAQNLEYAQETNWGLLLRIEAALSELRALRALPEIAIQRFLERAAEVIQHRLANDAAFLPLPIRPLERSPLPASTWDGVTTIFPFLMRHPSGVLFTRDATAQLYHYLREDMSGHAAIPPAMHALAARRCYVGQPVLCGEREGIPLSALRLNMDARLIVDALSPDGSNAEKIIAEALEVLDKAALLVKYMF